MALLTFRTTPTLDTVEFPDQTSVSLGTVSILSALSYVAPTTRLLDKALESLEKNGFCMVVCPDEADFRDFLLGCSPRGRFKYSSDMTCFFTTMDRQLKVKFASLEMATALVARASKTGSVPLALLGQLKVAAEEFCQGCNAIGEASAQEPAAPAAQDQQPVQAQTAGDLAVAEQTLAMLNSTEAKIASLLGKGKKFNATRARKDLARVASQVGSAFGGEAIDQAALQAAHAEADRLAKLFPLNCLFSPNVRISLPMPTSNKPESTYIYRMGTAPNTRAAVSQKNKIYSYVNGKNQFQQLGIVSEFGVDESRSVDKVRGIGMGDQIAELVPSITETTLSVTATLLYALNLFQMMGYKAGVDGLVRSLKHHRWPFDIKQELVFSYIASNDTASADGLQVSGFKEALTQPVSTNGIDIGETNIKALFTFFEGCWMNSYGTSFSSESGVVTNNCGIDVSDVIDCTTLYGEYMNTGLAPGVDGNSLGKGSSIRFGQGPGNIVGLLVV